MDNAPNVFEWDAGNREKCTIHGVSREEIESVFSSPVMVREDYHSATEFRFQLIGKTARGRYVFVAFTIRNGRIRPISARYMHAKEISLYEKKVPGTED